MESHRIGRLVLTCLSVSAATRQSIANASSPSQTQHVHYHSAPARASSEPTAHNTPQHVHHNAEAHHSHGSNSEANGHVMTRTNSTLAVETVGISTAIVANAADHQMATSDDDLAASLSYDNGEAKGDGSNDDDGFIKSKQELEEHLTKELDIDENRDEPVLKTTVLLLAVAMIIAFVRHHLYSGRSPPPLPRSDASLSWPASHAQPPTNKLSVALPHMHAPRDRQRQHSFASAVAEFLHLPHIHHAPLPTYDTSSMPATPHELSPRSQMSVELQWPASVVAAPSLVHTSCGSQVVNSSASHASELPGMGSSGADVFSRLAYNLNL